MIKDMHERLKKARIEAGFRSAAEAANKHGWKVPTYSGHENGSRGIKLETVLEYAAAFRIDPIWLAFGKHTGSTKIANIPDHVLREVLIFVLNNADFEKADKEKIVDTILDICKYVHKSGSTGLENVVDFQMHRLAKSGTR